MSQANSPLTDHEGLCDYAKAIKYQASETEVHALREICRAWRADGEFWEFDSLLSFLSTSGHLLFYSEDELHHGRWKGLIIGHHVLDQAEVMFIYVKPEFRKQKIGSYLLGALTHHLSKASKPLILSLEVKHNNEKAIGLYESAGMKKTAVRKKYYSTGEDAFIFQHEF